MRRARLRVRPSQRWSRMVWPRSRTGGGGRSRGEMPPEPSCSRSASVTCSRQRAKERRPKPALRSLLERIARTITTKQLNPSPMRLWAACVATFPTLADRRRAEPHRLRFLAARWRPPYSRRSRRGRNGPLIRFWRTPVSSPDLPALVKKKWRFERRIWHHKIFAAKFQPSKNQEPADELAGVERRLAIRPGVIGLGQPVLEPVLTADAVEDMPHPGRRRPIAVFGQVSKRHAVVGQDRVDRIREHGDHLPQEGRPIHLRGCLEEGDVGELAHAIDCQEHVELAFCQAQVAVVDVDVADLGLGKAPALGGLLSAFGQSRDAVAHETAVKGAAGQLGGALAQAAENVTQGKDGAAPDLDDDGLLSLG